MPVIKKRPIDVAYSLLKGNIKKRMEANQVTNKQMASITGMHHETFARKTNHPERFTLTEFIYTVNKLKFTDDEILEAVKFGGANG